MKCCSFFITAILGSIFLACNQNSSQSSDKDKPNIVLILADDLGYGDLGCYGAKLIKTPNCDNLAQQGMLFTDAHSPAAVCAPTRYSLLSGNYDFRKGNRAWFKHDVELAFDSTEITMASMLKEAGYFTACIGKWHLGFGRQGLSESASLNPGPNESGFDYFYGMYSNQGEKYTYYIENHTFVNDPENNEFQENQFRNNKTTCMLLRKAKNFIETNKDKPFFLYYPTQTIHEPIVPDSAFYTSNAGIYGHFVQEFDWTVGEILCTIDSLGLAKNTIVIVTSDNGGLMKTDYEGIYRNYVVNGHKMNGNFRGQKADIFEGGHRVPFIVRWPG